MKFNKGYIPEANSLKQNNSNLISGARFEKVFTLVPKSSPFIVRKCCRCEENRFVSSDKFRVNANKKVIDVWLIYKCVSCENTLNISIISRKSIANIDKALLDSFHKNEPNLVWRYAFDPTYIEKDMEADWKIDFDVVQHSTIACFDLHLDSSKSCCFLIQSQFFLKIPIFVVLRKIFNLSRSQLDKMQALGNLELSYQGKNLTLKKSIGFGVVIEMDI